MAKSAGGKTGIGAIQRPEPINKKTSIGGNRAQIKTSSMNKGKRRSYKAYRGQGR